jgi:pimeloyl-ACP methyl ester carboxylesterase
LALAGHDIWLGNNRGNRYSRKHVSYDPVEDKKKFFDYSFYEFGQFDLPAMIDLALKVTGFDKLNFIGHSQGAT